MKIIFFLLLSICGDLMSQTFHVSLKNREIFNYYVSNNGSDNNPGTKSLPFQTINKAITTVQSNQSIGLERGSIFQDTISFYSKNNISIGAYGIGTNPVVNLLKTITGWTNAGNIWHVQDSHFPPEITTVFFGSTRGILARYPKINYKSATGGTVYSLIANDTSARADNYWNGCELVTAPFTWYIKVIRCTTYSNKTFNFWANDTNSYHNFDGTIYAGLTPGHGYYGAFGATNGTLYFIQNHKNCITTANEWAYDSIAKTIYIYSSGSPSNISVSYYKHGIKLVNCNNIAFNNINFAGASDNTIDAYNCSQISFNNLTISNSGRHGFLLDSCQNIVIKNDSIIDSNNRAIYLRTSHNALIMNNYIDRCDSIIGWGRYDITYDAMMGMIGQGIYMLRCYLIELSYNIVKNTGYAGIEFLTTNAVNIHHNYVWNYATNMIDCGGIRTFYCNYSYNNVYHKNPYSFNYCQIKNNIIDRMPTIAIYKYGIYCDEGSSFIDAQYNYSTNSHFAATIEGDSHIIKNNTFITTGVGSDKNVGLWINGNQTPLSGGNNDVEYNDFILQYVDNPVYAYDLGAVRGSNIFNNNRYYLPFGQAPAKNDSIFYMSHNTETMRAQNLHFWTVTDQTTYNWHRTNEQIITPSLWVNSTKSKTNYVYPLVNFTRNNKIVKLSDMPHNDYIKLDGTTPTYPITIAPYEWLILVRTEQ